MFVSRIFAAHDNGMKIINAWASRFPLTVKAYDHNATSRRQRALNSGVWLLVTFLLSTWACVMVSLDLCNQAYGRGEYAEAERCFVERGKSIPKPPGVEEGLSKTRTAWSQQLLKEADQIPSTDLENKLAKIKKAAELTPDNSLVLQKVKELETQANNIRAEAAKIRTLSDDGDYLSAQAILNRIRGYKLAEVKDSTEFLNNSVKANDLASRLDLSSANLFSAYYELMKAHDVKLLGRKVKGLLADKLAMVRPRLIEALSSKIEAEGESGSQKLSTKLARFYRDSLASSSEGFQPIEVAAGRIGADSISVTFYSKSLKFPIDRLRENLEPTAISKMFKFVFLQPKPAKESLVGVEFAIVLRDPQEKPTERRDKPQTKHSEYISSSKQVPNPQYQIAQSNYNAAVLENNRVQIRCKNPTLGELIVCIPMMGSAKSKLDQASSVLQSTPQYNEEVTKTAYQYREYDVTAQSKFQLSYQIIDFNKKIEHPWKKFEWTGEQKWKERENVHPKDTNGLQNTQRDGALVQQFTSAFKNEVYAKVSQKLLEEVLSVLNFQFAESRKFGDVGGALETAILYTAALSSSGEKPKSDDQVRAFVTANFLSIQLPSVEWWKNRPSVDPEKIFVLDPDKRISLEAMEDMLKNYVAPRRVATLAEEQGISFELTDEVKSRLRKAGNDELVKRLEAL
jgi:hypothetical protein